MKRRDLLAGALGATVLTGGAYVGTQGLPGRRRETIDPVTIETLEATGSEGGTLTVPIDGEPAVIEVFATWCDVCSDFMPALAAAQETWGDDVRFVSVTNEPVGFSVEVETVRTWWDDHDGAWSVGVDTDLSLTNALDVSNIPTTVVFDRSGAVHWRDVGAKSPEELSAILEEVA
ncbi:MAG: TlpA family protein disulfide reductase [Halobacteriota archaeon]